MRTRRKFLLNCTAVAVTASVAPVGVFAAPRRLGEVPLEQVPFSTFVSHLNATFLVQADAGPALALQLVEASPTSSPTQDAGAPDAANEKFSLLFRGPLAQPLEQDTYWFACQTIGRFAMFIVPIGSTETTHSYYEAVFNRPVEGPFRPAGQGNNPWGRPAPDSRRPDRTNLR